MGIFVISPIGCVAVAQSTSSVNERIAKDDANTNLGKYWQLREWPGALSL